MIKYSILALAPLLLSAIPAHSGVPCMPRDTAISELMGARYSELPLFEGTLSTPDQAPVAVTVFANPSTGTWTMMVSPDGKVSCLILSGKDFKPASVRAVTGRLSQLD
jgi:hypothetical protein